MRPIAVGVLVLCGATAPAWPQQGPRLTIEPFVIRGFDGVERSAERGRFEVPARRAQPAAGTVELAIVRLKATTASPGDPIVFLMGGPGIPASVMAQVPVYAQLFDRLRAVADVVLLDQRGTGSSRPALDCPARDASLAAGAFESQATLLTEMLTETRACVAAWRAKGVEPAAYSSGESAADVEDLRLALRVERLNLLAFSYGTELALTVIRKHGDGVARAVLAGVRGPDHLLKLPSTFDTKARRLSRLAAESPVFAGVLRGPDDLVGRLERILRATAKPLLVRVIDQRTKLPVELRVGRQGLQTVLTQSIDSARFPALVVALEQGDTRVLSRVLESLYNTFSRGGSSLMARAVNCSTGASPARLRRVSSEAEWALLGAPFDDAMVSAEYCGVLGGIEVDAGWWRPLTSDVPTLFISGSLDSNTPPAQAEEVRYGFRHASHLVIENASHETLPLAGAQDVIVDFFKGGDVAGRRVAAALPIFMTVEEAANQPCGPRGC